MKKFLFLMTALVIVFLLVACQTEGTSSVLFDNRTLVLEVGDQVVVSLQNEDSVQLSDVVFSTQDESIVTISENGELTGVASGFTSVSLTYNGQADYIIVSVYDPNDLPVDGKEVSLRVDSGFIQWQYIGETDWTNLVALESLIGPDGLVGAPGQNGTDGDQVEFRVESGYIQWKYVQNETWSNLLSLISITGNDGDDVELRVSETHIQWKNTKDDDWTNLVSLTSLAGRNGTDGVDGVDGTDGVDGVNGKEVEFTRTETHIQWRYVGENTWTDLVVLDDLQGVSVVDAYFDTDLEDDILVFELSNGQTIQINYTEMYNQSKTYNDLLEYIDDLHDAVRDELLNEKVLSVLKIQYDMYERLLTAFYNSPLDNEYFASYDLGLNNDYYEGGSWVQELSSALAFQYLYELSMDNEIDWDQNSLVMDAFQRLFGEDFYFLEVMFDYLPSYELAIGLGVSSIYHMEFGEDLNFEDGNYLPLMPLIEYLSVLSTYDESSFYQYLTLNPNTDWDFNSFYDRHEYMTALALGELGHDVNVELDPLNLGIELMTTEMPYGNYGHSNNWTYGGDAGVYDETFNRHYYRDIEINFGRNYRTIDFTKNIYDLNINSESFYAYVNYGASFPLPKQNAFTNDNYYEVVDGGGHIRYFKLEGYTYSNGYNDNVDSFDNVAFGSNNEQWGENYYSFDGYFTNPFDDNELNIEAVWVEYFLVSFYDGDEDLIKDEFVRTGDDAQAPSDPTPDTGYEFDGWSSDFNNVEESLDIYPIFDPITYYILYEDLGSANNAVGNVSTYTIETNTITLSDPTNLPEGYEFNGWFDLNNIEVTEITEGSYGDITLYARIELITYVISYILNDGTEGDNPSEFNQNDLTITLVDSFKTGYSFDGWYSDSSFENEVTSISTIGDKTLYAKFTINEYTITFDTNGGSTAPNQITQDYGTSLTAPNNPTRTGYEFTGWVDQFGDSFSFTSMPAYDTQLTAQWEIEVFDVRFEYSVFENSSVEIDTQTVEYGSSATLPTPPVIPGYSFVEWTGSVDNITGDTTIVANYTAYNYIMNISVLDGEGSIQVSGRPNVNRTITITATPEAGYIFNNWSVYYYDESGIKQDVSVVSSTSASTTFVMPAYNVVIEASFEESVLFPATLFFYNDQLNDELAFDGSISDLIEVVTEDVFEFGGYPYLNFNSWDELFDEGGYVEIYVNDILYNERIDSAFDLNIYSDSLSYLVTSSGSSVKVVFFLPI